jgi:hypothetical protein
MLRTCLVALAVAVIAGAPVSAAEVGTPALKSIEAIAFGPDGLLLIGDGKGAQIVSVETGDTTPREWTVKDIADIKGQLAGRIGATAKGIEITKLAVNPASRVAYVAVRKLDGKQDMILTISGDGKINEFALEKVKHTVYALPVDSKDGNPKITDLTWAGDRILAAATAGQTFKSRFYSMMVNAKADVVPVSFGTDTYHVAHKRWETDAPIRTVIPYEENGKKYLVGAFTCTPIVKYALEDMTAGARVKGVSVIELGNGNTPQSMFTYEKDGKTYILMNVFRMFHKQSPVGPSPYWTARVDHEILKETEKVNKDAPRRVNDNAANKPLTDRAVVAPDYHGVMLMSRLNATQALTIRTDGKDNISMAVLALP